MNSDITQLFVWATKRTFSAMLDWDVDQVEDEPSSTNDVSGIVGLSGDVTGSIVLILPQPLAISATEGLIGGELNMVTGDVIDTIGELTNIIAGGAKSRIDLQVNLSLPTVVTGGQHCVAYDSQTDPVAVHFLTGRDRFTVKYCINSPATLDIIGAAAAELAV